MDEERRRVKGVILNKFRVDESSSMGIKERCLRLGMKSPKTGRCGWRRKAPAERWKPHLSRGRLTY
ncbi:hypothetical protein J7L18_00385 [Candidatus Bathyarchaeota archaeon]|nr:hypothetical protein [Candidatus Bathyarchaeota archaeon]